MMDSAGMGNFKLLFGAANQIGYISTQTLSQRSKLEQEIQRLFSIVMDTSFESPNRLGQTKRSK